VARTDTKLIRSRLEAEKKRLNEELSQLTSSLNRSRKGVREARLANAKKKPQKPWSLRSVSHLRTGSEVFSMKWSAP